MKTIPTYTTSQTLWLVILRVMIGWHFLYEGLAKILSPNWTAYPYLMDSQGVFSDLYYNIATNPTFLSVAEFLNMLGLTLVGFCLIMGLFSRMASIGGVLFLIMYYLSHPPFIGAEYLMPNEGTYLWVDKNLIELGALMVLFYFPTSHIIGLDRLINRFFTRTKLAES